MLQDTDAVTTTELDVGFSDIISKEIQREILFLGSIDTTSQIWRV